MATSQENSVQVLSIDRNPELLVQKFYTLRKAFEADYSGNLRSHKYEETREFTISLNYGIFQANQLLGSDYHSLQEFTQLEAKLASLKKEFSTLIHC